MTIILGRLEVTLKNTYLRGKSIIYQRAVPTKLRDRYAGRTVKHDLKTGDMAVAAKAVALLNKRYDAEFSGLTSSPQSLKAHAIAFLKARGLTPEGRDNEDMAVELFHDALDLKRERFARDDAEVYRNARPEDYLTPVEIEAAQRLYGTAPKTLHDALEMHLEIHASGMMSSSRHINAAASPHSQPSWGIWLLQSVTEL